MLTKGSVKLLDFGLAKLAALTGAASAISSSSTREQPLPAQGAILGTFRHKEPEQLEGRDADAQR